MLRIPWKQVNWLNSLFLIFTLLLTLTAVPIYLWRYGLDWFQVSLFVVMFMATGMSITLGYHRLFSHRAFAANPVIRFLTLVFGAAAFENSALCWSADHRRHHKHVDHDEDPYDISKGFFHAHMGWIMIKLEPHTSFDYAKDLLRDRLVMWQHRYYVPIAITAGYLLPALIGGLWNGVHGALGGLLIAGIARTVCVQQMTFFINSLCHTIGNRPYSSQCTARDSGLMAFFTFGEGYHNFHHAFQHDYRNGVKPWQFDPTKWAIWLLCKFGLAKDLRRVPEGRIMMAEVAEQQRLLSNRLEVLHIPTHAERLRERMAAAQASLHEAFVRWEKLESEYAQSMERKLNASREKLAELQREVRDARDRVYAAMREWRETHQSILSQLAEAAPA
jgi:stearoyl-CoA desaturase (delta-9 desaturase)